MSDNDLIRRGDALAAVQAAYDDSGFEPDLADANARIAALPAVTVGVKPLDLSCVQKHAFLSGVVAARNVPPGDPCSGPLLWLDYDPGDHPALARIIAALDLTPAPDAAAIRAAALKLVQIYDSAMDDLLGEDVHRTHPDSDEMAEIRRVLGAPALLTEKPHDRA